MNKVIFEIQDAKTIILIGSYAQKHFLGKEMKKTLTETIVNGETYFPKFIVLPHPSPRNNIWLKKNPWFEEEKLPILKTLIKNIL